MGSVFSECGDDVAEHAPGGLGEGKDGAFGRPALNGESSLRVF